MTPHLQVEHLSLNLLSFQLIICLTQLYIVCSVESAVLINTTFCCFTSVWYSVLNCFLCGLLQDLPICHSCCNRLHMRTVLHWDACLLSHWQTYQVICSIFSRRWSQHWTWIRWTMGNSWSNAALMMTCKVWIKHSTFCPCIFSQDLYFIQQCWWR